MSSRSKVPKNIRELILKLYGEGKKCGFISEYLNVNLNTVYTTVRRSQLGTLDRPRGHRKKMLEQHEIDKLHEWIEEDCQRTLEDLRDKLNEYCDKFLHVSTIFRYLRDLHFSFKRVSRVPETRVSDRMIEERFNYAVKFLQLYRDREKIFFIDETGIQVHCRTNYGRSRRGERANVTVRAIRGKNYSVCAAMNFESLFFYEAQDASYNTDHFIGFLEKFLNHLQENNLSGCHIFMDNVRFHHADQVERLVSEKGHHIHYIPAYSCFLNPIENLFNQLKFYVKRMRPENADKVFEAVELASQVISSDDCANYFRNMLNYIDRCLQREKIFN